MGATGMVFLVGAGPGDPELLTLRGAEVLGRADVVIYDGLANAVLLDHAAPHSEKIYAGKKHSDRGQPLDQDQINALLVRHARAGKTVVRLKGGDPFVFGRGGEEAEVLAAADVPFEIVPGVSAISSVPAYAGIPITHRDAASSVVALVTGHEAEGKPAPAVDWTGIAHADTIVLFMGVKTLGDTAAALVAAGRAATTPVAVIRWGTTAAQRTIVGTLGDIAARAAAVDLKPPALVVIGEVVQLRDRLAWYERRPLFGVRVLVPRQKEQARGFARALVALGAEPVIWDVTRIVETDPAPLDAALAKLPGGWRWVAFSSANAVDRTFEALDRLGGDARAFYGVRLAAIGPATAAALRRHGLAADLVPERHDGTGVAAALLAADPDVPGTPVLLPRAAEGREELAAVLGAAGVEVTAVAAYRTVAAPPAELAPLAERLAAGEIDVLTFFSPSQLTAVLGALDEVAGPAILGRARLIAAVGGTTAAALREHGLRVDVVAPAPSAESLAAAIEQYYTEHAGAPAGHTPPAPDPQDKEP